MEIGLMHLETYLEQKGSIIEPKVGNNGGDLGNYFRNMNLDYNQRGSGSAMAIGGYSYLRNPKGDILINPTSGLPIINANFLPIGDRTPDFTIGLTNKFSCALSKLCK